MRSDWLRPLPPATRFIFQGNALARGIAGQCWGVSFAETACRATCAGNRAALWLGPDEYLLLDDAQFSDTADAASFASTLAPALKDVAHSLVDISHRQVAWQLSGEHITDILSGACPLDLHVRAFPVGMCTRTLLAKAEVVLWRTGADAFRLEAWRSFAPYVIALLEEIAMDLES
jgi:sarcosine oxidase, subunit gamma